MHENRMFVMQRKKLLMSVAIARLTRAGWRWIAKRIWREKSAGRRRQRYRALRYNMRKQNHDFVYDILLILIIVYIGLIILQTILIRVN